MTEDDDKDGDEDNGNEFHASGVQGVFPTPDP